MFLSIKKKNKVVVDFKFLEERDQQILLEML